MTTPLLPPPAGSARTLPIEEARKLALQWQKRLPDMVLEQTSDESAGIAKSYAWIQFDFITNRRYQVSAARAAAVTWFALSCCPGYGGHENPAFWKGVLSDRSSLNFSHNRRADQCITDAYGFFDGDGMEFPRFKVKVYGEETNALLLFCGDPGQELEPDDKAKLAQVMVTLASWIDPERTTRQTVVSLEDVYRKYARAYGDEITTLEAQRPNEWPLERFISESNRLTVSGWPSPVFAVKELDLRTSSFYEDPVKRKWLSEIMRTHETDIHEFALDTNRPVSRDALGVIVRDALGLPGSSVRARTTSFRVLSQALSSVPAIVSALPMTTSIQSMMIDNNRAPNETAQRTALIWMAYALFHPDTPLTPWKSLNLKGTAVSEQSVAALQAMARGNNLVAMLEGREPTSDGYYRARLAVNTIVYDQPGGAVADQSEKIAIGRSDGSLEVEVCDVASDDPTQWSEWVAVVLPAYGLGWVRSAAVTSVVKRTAAESSLTLLKMSSFGQHIPLGTNSLGGVLSVLGHRLVHLDLHSFAKLASSADLVQVLSCCPSLESLGVQYQIDVWDSEAVARVLPQLRKLELCLNDTHLAPFRVPPSLHLLRVNASASRGAYARSADALRHILMQPSQLRVFHWKDGYAALYIPKDHWSTCYATKKRLEALEVPPKSAECVDTRLPAACAAAFLSVISQPVQDTTPSVVTRLDKWMAMSIVGFAGSRTTRLVVIEPTVREVVEAPHYFDPNIAYCHPRRG